MKRKLFFGVLFFLLSVVSVFSQDNWDAYKPRTLKEITTKIAAESLKNPDVEIKNEKKDLTIVLSYNSY